LAGLFTFLCENDSAKKIGNNIQDKKFCPLNSGTMTITDRAKTYRNTLPCTYRGSQLGKSLIAMQGLLIITSILLLRIIWLRKCEAKLLIKNLGAADTF